MQLTSLNIVLLCDRAFINQPLGARVELREIANIIPIPYTCAFLNHDKMRQVVGCKYSHI